MASGIIVCDASAMIAFLQGEPGGDLVYNRLADPANTALTHAVNLCEVAYHFLHRNGEAAAAHAVEDLKSVGIGVRADLDEALWLDVARVKAAVLHVALADCFLLALARRTGSTALTADRHELEPVRDRALASIEFIR